MPTVHSHPKMLRLVCALVFATSGAALTACGGDASGGEEPTSSNQATSTEPDTFAASGTAALTSEEITVPEFSKCLFSPKTSSPLSCKTKKGMECSGRNQYSDLAEGAQVRVQDSTGEVVALGELGPGTLSKGGGLISGESSCLFPFEVPDVPDTGSIYGIQVETSDLVNFTIDEAGALELTLA